MTSNRENVSISGRLVARRSVAARLPGLVRAVREIPRVADLEASSSDVRLQIAYASDVVGAANGRLVLAVMRND